MKSLFSTLSLSLVLVTGLLGACTKTNKMPTDTVRYRIHTEPPNLDWNLSADTISYPVIMSMMEGLLDTNSDGKIEARLAESWQIAPDQKTYTFKIRGGAKWSDGVAVSAQNFVDAWQRVLDPKLVSTYSYFLFDVQGAEEYNKGQITDFAKVGVKAPDPGTLVVTLKKPVSYWIQLPSFYITFPVRKDLIDKHGDRWTEAGKLVTTGVYVPVKHERDSRILMDKNAHYWDAAITAKVPAHFEFRVVKDDNTALALFDNKGLDLLREPPAQQIPQLKDRPEFLSQKYLRATYVGFNVQDSDVKLRQALAYAIDRRELEKALGPIIRAQLSWVPEGLQGYGDEVGLPYNPELAKKLWAEVKDKPAKLEYWFDTKERNRIVAEVLQSQWKKVLGADVQLQNQEWKVYLKQLASHSPPMFRMSWGADYQDADNFMSIFICKGGNNWTNFCDARYDELVRIGATSFDEQKRTAAYVEAQKILIQQKTAIVPLFSERNVFLVSQRVEGFRTNLMGSFMIRDIRLK